MSEAAIMAVGVAVVVLLAAVLAASIIVLSYRRHASTERAGFDTAYAGAARQLGAQSPAERLAGVYAMAQLADRAEPRSPTRQQCIDVLCSYLRLPYEPDRPDVASSTVEQVAHFAAGQRREAWTVTALPHDAEVRRSIIRIIRDHLQPDSSPSWEGHELNLTGAVLDGGDFSGVRLTAGRLLLAGANFRGGWFSFDGAVFDGADVSLDGAVFDTGHVSFDDAVFNAGDVSFVDATVSGATVSFGRARINGGQLLFADLVLESGQVGFESASFTDGRVLFDGLRVGGGALCFDAATFSGSRVSLEGGDVRAGRVSFAGAQLRRGRVSLAGTRVGAGVVSFDDAEIAVGVLIGPADARRSAPAADGEDVGRDRA